MVNRRPSPEQLAARKYEIARRYRRKAGKLANRSRGMAAIRLAELTRWLDDAFGQGVELEPSKQGEMIARIFAHHLGALPDSPRRITRWTATYAPWISPRDLERLIREVIECPIKWSADKLAWKMRLNEATRARLKIKTIGAMDCSRDQRQAIAKAKRAARDAIRRPRKPKAAKPWIAAGISREHGSPKASGTLTVRLIRTTHIRGCNM
jgi:hypothetical protein